MNQDERTKIKELNKVTNKKTQRKINLTKRYKFELKQQHDLNFEMSPICK
jgi:hypothetical protein